MTGKTFQASGASVILLTSMYPIVELYLPTDLIPWFIFCKSMLGKDQKVLRKQTSLKALFSGPLIVYKYVKLARRFIIYTLVCHYINELVLNKLALVTLTLDAITMLAGL